MKRMLGSLLLGALFFCIAFALASCGTRGDVDPSKADVSAVRRGSPEIHSWVTGVVDYCKQHDDKAGILVEVTGLITEGSSSDTVSHVTLVDPNSYLQSGDEDMLGNLGAGSIEVRPGDPCAEVYYAEPIKATPWSHLTTVRGVAQLDSEQENKIVVYSAIEVH